MRNRKILVFIVCVIVIFGISQYVIFNPFVREFGNTLDNFYKNRHQPDLQIHTSWKLMKKCLEVTPKWREFPVKSTWSEDIRKIVEYRNKFERHIYEEVLYLCVAYLRFGRYENLDHTIENFEEPVRVFVHPRPRDTFFVINVQDSAANRAGECEVGCEIVNEKSRSHVELVILDDTLKVEEIEEGKKYAFITSEQLWFPNGNRKLNVGSGPIVTKYDYIMSFYPFSDIPLYYLDYESTVREYRQYLQSSGRDFEEETGTKFRQQLETNFRKKRTDVKVIAFISHCNFDDKSHPFYRSEYFRLLAEEIEIHNVGVCPVGTRIKEKKDYWRGDITDRLEKYDKKIEKIRNYKFYIAFENTLGPNYVTEKLYHGFLAKYTIPIYIGAPNIHDFLSPRVKKEYKAFINANLIPNPSELADLLKYLDQNETAYMEYFKWREDGIKLNPDYKIPHFENSQGNVICDLCKHHKEFMEGRRFDENFQIGPVAKEEQESETVIKSLKPQYNEENLFVENPEEYENMKYIEVN